MSRAQSLADDEQLIDALREVADSDTDLSNNARAALNELEADE